MSKAEQYLGGGWIGTIEDDGRLTLRLHSAGMNLMEETLSLAATEQLFDLLLNARAKAGEKGA